MVDRLKVVTEKGKDVLYVDLSGLPSQNIIEIFPELNKIAFTKKIRLFIFNITNTHTTVEVKNASKASIQEIESKLGKIASALFGLTGIQKIIANAISKDQYFAKDYADAMRWVLEQSEKM